MKIQLTLLLVVVLLASLPSVVFSQPPLSAVQSGETSQTAKATERVQKSWEGPFYGLGIGLGYGRATVASIGASVDLPPVAAIPVQTRLGYGLSDSIVLYGSILGLRFTGQTSQWAPPAALLGMMWKWSGRDSYGFTSVGFGFEGDPRPLYVRGGSGTEVYPGIFAEAAASIEYVNLGSVSTTAYVFDLTFNYHWY